MNVMNGYEMCYYINMRVFMILGKNMNIVDLNIMYNKKEKKVFVSFKYNMNDKCECECDHVEYKKMFKFNQNIGTHLGDIIINSIVKEFDDKHSEVSSCPQKNKRSRRKSKPSLQQ